MSIQIRIAGLVAAAMFASDATAQTAVEWRQLDGGNGHWYRIILIPSGTSWTKSKIWAEAMGGHLATISNAAENGLLSTMIGASGPWFSRQGSDPGFDGPWIGGFRNSYEQPWQWVTGEPWDFTAWCSNQPSNVSYCDGPETRLTLKRDAYCSSTQNWGDFPDSGICHPVTTMSAMLVEWEADCNADGIVDYGQILRGELIDLNSNGVPDICETSISSVIPPSVPSQGGSTITIRGNFPPNPTVKVGGIVATNVNRVSITQITATVPALLPGMASVQVNDFTLPDALYIRPECGSDLDQNGSVDAGDISIILLDFGPCYEPPAALAAPAPTPLLADEPGQKPVQR